jgi:hypothetical protein
MPKIVKLREERVIKRETRVMDRLRSITIELHPRYCRIGIKNTREAYDVPWDLILDRARLNAAKLAERKRA